MTRAGALRVQGSCFCEILKKSHFLILAKSIDATVRNEYNRKASHIINFLGEE